MVTGQVEQKQNLGFRELNQSGKGHKYSKYVLNKWSRTTNTFQMVCQFKAIDVKYHLKKNIARQLDSIITEIFFKLKFNTFRCEFSTTSNYNSRFASKE